LNRRRLLVLAALLAAVAVLLAVSGGVRATVGGLRISARSPMPAAAMALAAAAAWLVLARRAASVGADLDGAWSAVNTRGSSIVFLIAVSSAVASAAFATNSAAGADASGYLSEAAQWAAGRLYHQEPLAGIIGAFDPWLTAPLGWRPGPFPGWQSPTYPPGLPLLMALPHAFGGAAAAGLVVALGAGLATFSTGMIAARLAGGAAGMLAALLIATSPVLLYQAVQPMSDVPVTAAWMACWALLVWPGVGSRESGPPSLARRSASYGEVSPKRPWAAKAEVGSALAGVACAVAVLIRPNLAPLAAVPLFAIGLNARRLVMFSLPVAAAAAALMWLQWQWYGSPFRSGYGAAEELFAFTNIGANASRYFGWLVATAPILLIAPIGVWLAWRTRPARPLAVFAVLVVAAYLVYAVFDVWSYLRFLLPAIAVAAVFTAVAIAVMLQRMRGAARVAVLLAFSLAQVAHGVSQARARDTFRLVDQQRRVSQAATFLATLPTHTVIVAGEQSGALRYYTGLSILRWDLASPESLISSLVALGVAGKPVVIALDAWEREPFRARFRAVASVSLEWPAAFEAGTSHRTYVWRLSDRERFLAGERTATVRQP